MLERVRVHTIITRIHHVVVRAGKAKSRVGGREDLESFVTAGRGYNGVGGCNGRYNVLDDSLGHGISYARNGELVGTFQGLLVEPRDMRRVIVVESVI